MSLKSFSFLAFSVLFPDFSELSGMELKDEKEIGWGGIGYGELLEFLNHDISKEELAFLERKINIVSIHIDSFLIGSFCVYREILDFIERARSR